MAGNARITGVSQAERIVDLLRSFDREHPRQTLSQISRRVGMPVGTCHRLVTELTRLNILVRNTDKTYSISRLVWELGMLSPVQKGIRDVAVPFMYDLLAATRQIVNLFVPDGKHSLLLERISGTAVGEPIAAPGDRLPLHSSASGKLFLAYGVTALDDISDPELTHQTRYTITDRGQLRGELANIRRQGWARTSQEHRHGAYSLAVPVVDEYKRVVAALGIVSLTEIRSPGTVIPALKVTSSAITRSLPPRGWDTELD